MTRTLAIAAVLLVLAAFTGRLLERERARTGIPLTPARVPLGGFEPLAVDLLFTRAETLRQEGRLAEAATAYRLVTDLQPKVADAWSFPAWLLAWTDSNAGDPEREWGWVEQAIGMLRRGLEANPGDPNLLLTLGLVFYRRLAREDDIYELATRRLGERPEELAIRFLSPLDGVPGTGVPGALADSWRLLGGRRLAAGDREGGLRALREALPYWRRLGARDDGEVAAKMAERIEAKIAEIESR